MAEKKGIASSLVALLDEPPEVGFSRLFTWRFWRAMISYFCIFSIAGHLVEYPYCWLGMTFFNSVEPDSEVLVNPLKPFFVYGIGIVLCCVFLEPLRKLLIKRHEYALVALLIFYLIAVFLGMLFELGQGYLQNQPDPVTGEYPLWDVSDYPGNILGQAWIVNDLGIGALITLVVWLVLPLCSRLSRRMSVRNANILCAASVLVTLVLTIVTYVFV